MAHQDVTFATDHFTLTNVSSAGSFFSQIIGVFFEKIVTTPTITVTTQPLATQTAHASGTVVVTSTDTTDNSTLVTATLLGGGTLSGTTTATMAAGVATFANLIPTGVGSNRQYHFAATGYTATDSNAFDVTANAETTLHRSDFTGANGTLVTALTPTIGTALRTISPDDGERVYGNTSSSVAAALTRTGNFTNQTLPADVTARARITRVDASSCVRALWVRGVDTDHYYMIQLEGGNTLVLYKDVANAFTSLGSASVSTTIGTPFTMALQADGPLLHVFFDGAEVFTAVTDTTYSAAGYAGFISLSISVPATDSNGYKLDYFEVTTPAASGGASALLLLSASA